MPIQLNGRPERYELTYSPEGFNILNEEGNQEFGPIATSDMPKLYVASIAGTPVYVGQTKTSMQRRLYGGWNAAGRNGYHGYAWRTHGTNASLDVWGHVNAPDRNPRDMETIEAEVVYLIRRMTNQWPAFQTEIHFYPSTAEHRQFAEHILGLYEID